MASSSSPNSREYGHWKPSKILIPNRWRYVLIQTRWRYAPLAHSACPCSPASPPSTASLMDSCCLQVDLSQGLANRCAQVPLCALSHGQLLASGAASDSRHLPPSCRPLSFTGHHDHCRGHSLDLVRSDPDQKEILQTVFQIPCLQVSLYYMKSSCMLFIGGLMVAIAGCILHDQGRLVNLNNFKVSFDEMLQWRSVTCIGGLASGFFFLSAPPQAWSSSSLPSSSSKHLKGRIGFLSVGHIF